MMHYSIEPRDQIFLKVYEFLLFAKHMSKDVSRNLQRLLDHAKQSVTDALKPASDRKINKTVETTGYLIGNNIADKITKFLRSLPHNDLEAIESETEIIGFNKKIPKERYTSPEQRQQSINYLRSI